MLHLINSPWARGPWREDYSGCSLRQAPALAMRMLVKHHQTRRVVLPAEAGEDPRRVAHFGVCPQDRDACAPIVPDGRELASRDGCVKKCLMLAVPLGARARRGSMSCWLFLGRAIFYQMEGRLGRHHQPSERASGPREEGQTPSTSTSEH